MKTFNPVKFLKDFSIPARTEGPNAAPGWIQICCPFCSPPDTNFHGGFNIESGRYNCWRCGPYPLTKVIATLTNVPIPIARQTAWKYSTGEIIYIEKEQKIIPKSIELPFGCSPLWGMYRNYLTTKRGMDAEYVERKFNLKASGYLGPYKFRIIAPIYFNRKLVSYQGRDITDLAAAPYKACEKDKEIIHHKHILYNIDSATDDSVIIVEGVADVWRMGDGAVATFGVKYTQEQVLLIAQNFRFAFILFDPDPPGIEQSQKLAAELSLLGVTTEIITIKEEDPAKMSDSDAKSLKKELIGKE